MVPNAGSCPSLCRLCKIFIPNLYKGKKPFSLLGLLLTNKKRQERMLPFPKVLSLLLPDWKKARLGHCYLKFYNTVWLFLKIFIVLTVSSRPKVQTSILVKDGLTKILYLDVTWRHLLLTTKVWVCQSQTTSLEFIQSY